MKIHGLTIRNFYGRTQAEATDKMDQARREAEQGRPVLSARDRKRTLADWLDEWLETSRATAGNGGIELSTWRFYESYVRNHISPTIGHIPLARLCGRDVRSMMAAALERQRPAVRHSEDGRAVRTGGRAGGTPYVANRCLAVLRTALSRAVTDGDKVIAHNVAMGIKPLKWDALEITPLSPDETIRLLKALEGHRLEGLAVLVLATGLREQEALGLQQENVDLERGLVRIRTALARHDGRYFLKGTKTQQSRRDLRIPEFAVPALKRWLALQQADMKRRGWHNDLGLFFTNDMGGPLHSASVLRHFTSVLETAGLKRHRFYDLRHGMASYMAAEGHNLLEIRAQMGWSNLSMVHHYTHLLSNTQDRVAATMDRLFGPSEALKSDE